MLPSQLMYANFENGEKYCMLHVKQVNNGKIKNAESTLKWLLKSDVTLANRIIHAYCYTYTKEKSGQPYYDPCKCLYYWIGDKIIGKFNDSYIFVSRMKAIYQELQKLGLPSQCNNIYPDMSSYIFSERKKIFNYNYNYQELMKQPGNNKYICTTQIEQCQKDAKGAYDSLISICNDDHESYCIDFKTSGRKGKSQVVSELKCEKVRGADFATNERSEDTTDKHSQEKVFLAKERKQKVLKVKISKRNV
ncbi:hypothetical protein PCYB_001560 [Plasmodium cynomolgi strain B]|uniref:CYIR protein n=1 Tax=Plasmodium cynomolgi (strain B) TaxID=1120755 RepID=K6UNE2_PLACD|nr:hypothetical protein PCYB_001560 [Plasmodium cynomolgi strain B]GAB69408.1 hypothetical protein PCYB_001560 [Plasmodium cynomolgi strain B]